MRQFLFQLSEAMPRINIRAVIDILLVALLIHQSAMIIRGAARRTSYWGSELWSSFMSPRC